MNDVKELSESFVSPCCRDVFAVSAGSLECRRCGKTYVLKGKVWDLRTILSDSEAKWDAEAFDQAYAEADGGFKDAMDHALDSGIPKIAEEYRQSVKENTLKSFVKKTNPRRLLDLGCGSGWLSLDLSKLCPETVFFGVDVSGFRVNVFKEQIISGNLQGRMETAIANGESLPLPDHLFDIVIMDEVIEHLQEPGKTVKEISRVLIPGGHLLITTPTKLMTDFWKAVAFLPSIIKRLLKGEPLRRSLSCTLYDEPLACAKLRKIFGESGLSVEKWERVIFLPHESYLQFIPLPLIRFLICNAKVLERIPFMGFLGMHHLIILRKT